MGERTLGTVLDATISILSIVLLGVAIRAVAARVKILNRPTKIFFRYLNIFVLWVVLPIVVFISIASIQPISQILGLGNAFLLAFIGLGVCFVLPVAISHVAKYDRKTTVALTLNSAFMNVTYLGFPIVYALVGKEGLGPAALYAMGIGIPHLILGIMLVSSVAKKRVTPGFLLEKVVTFPAAFALIVALLFVGFGAAVPDVVRNTFDFHLAKPFFALMLLVVGYQMILVRPAKYVKLLTTVGVIRFLVCPLLTCLVILILGPNATVRTAQPALILAAMPPAMFNLILAYNYKLDLRLYGALVFYLTLVSLFIVLPILSFFIL